MLHETHLLQRALQIGQHYLAAEWGQRLMTLSDFIDQHILCSSAPDAGEMTAAAPACFCLEPLVEHGNAVAQV